MDEVARLLTLLALVGGAFTLVGGAFVWFLDETRRIRRSLTLVLGAAPKPMLAARGRGLGIGFDLSTDRLAVTWDKGAWCLIYRVEELMGVELIVDRQVAARAFRGEPRRPLDHLAEPEERVRLRFVFDDAGHPDFEIDIWRLEDEGRSGRLDPETALHDANRWVARIESVLRRPIPPRQQVALSPPIPALVTTPEPAPEVRADPFFDDDDEDDPPWDDEIGDHERALN